MSSSVAPGEPRELGEEDDEDDLHDDIDDVCDRDRNRKDSVDLLAGLECDDCVPDANHPGPGDAEEHEEHDEDREELERDETRAARLVARTHVNREVLAVRERRPAHDENEDGEDELAPLEYVD